MPAQPDCCSPQEHLQGCLVCGGELFYTPDKALRARCFYCGEEEITHVFCLEGHFICNHCHSKDILEEVATHCKKSRLKDPLRLLLEIFEHPHLHRHGPEYHSIVPAVLVTAYYNNRGEKNASAIKEAILRGKDIFGGICGTHGACGAGIGVGIACAVILKTTPYSKKDRGEANRMTALALEAISHFGGPRCCKRDAVTAVMTAQKHFAGFGKPGASLYRCRQFKENEKCMGKSCPYHP